MKITVVLQLESGESEWREVEASIRDGIALQERFPDDQDPRPYRVIHVKSGVSLMAAESWLEAWEIREWFFQQIVNGVLVSDLPKCELCNIAPAMLGKVQKRFGKGDIENVPHIAKLLECQQK